MPIPELLIESTWLLADGAKDINWGVVACCGSLLVPTIIAIRSIYKKLTEINFKHERRAAMANLIAETDEELELDSAAGDYAYNSREKAREAIYKDSINIFTQQGQNERNQKK